MKTQVGFITLAITSALLAGCAPHVPSSPESVELSDPLPRPMPEGATIEMAGSIPGKEVLNTGLLGSLRPDDAKPEERVPAIFQRGRIIVGVDQSENLLAFRNPQTGEIEGFEADLAREIARDIFGDPSRVEFRYVNASTWVRAIESKQVDMVIRAISITRSRQDQVFFSTPYLTGRTRLLVHTNSGISNIGDLAGKTACASNDSTGLERTRRNAPETNILVAQSTADCLVALQQGQVVATVSDDTILSGMASQDPFTQIVGPSIGVEDYGIAIGKPGQRHKTEGLIRQVNATLERIFADGTWYALYSHWFGAYLKPQFPPALRYRPEQEERHG